MGMVLIAAILLNLAPGLSKAQEIAPRIINGQPAGDEFPSVGIVGSRRLGVFCTGTLISPLHVLTVAHGAQLITNPHDGTFTLDGEVYGTARIYSHPQYDSQTGANDIAILELSESVLDITPSSIFRGIPQRGDLLIIVGFGAGGTASTGSDGTFGTKLYGMTVIEEVSDTLIIWQFNDSQESNTAPGDSGGPGFLQVGQELFVASITSSGTLANAELGDIAFNTRVDAFADWIDTIVSAVDDGDGEQPDDGEDSDDQHPVPIVCAPAQFWPSPGTPSHSRSRMGQARRALAELASLGAVYLRQAIAWGAHSCAAWIHRPSGLRGRRVHRQRRRAIAPQVEWVSSHDSTWLPGRRKLADNPWAVR